MLTATFTVLAVHLLLAAGIQGKVTMRLYQDNNCETLVPGTGNTSVEANSCDTNVRTGWSSAKIIKGNYGTVTFYSHNNCAPSQPNHGYEAVSSDCLKDFGFVANAVGFLAQYSRVSGQSGMERLFYLNKVHIAD
ncbi:hypothetical protein F5B22DRAFT_648624 [Xylaria bambusicola]|uniref:uncharacterized protein n=1 Tax=Xylaria bambusicola TaxID=326684 RepID=UPI0020080270|nr:uncharacterized protein F5B22DRAFT_648624 [Xylaria bambusicola]KAI0512521.1 hypothetical protein F5B22DRAFT_648624 [Xylaria bambusicola]